MNYWGIRFLGQSSKLFRNLDQPIQTSFKIVIEELINTVDPTSHPKSKPLRYENSGAHRIKINKFRMLYTLNKEHNTIEIHKIGVRDKFYTE